MYCVILVTASNKKEAQAIADGLIESRLAACVTIVNSIDSIFWWQGKVDRATEALLVIKTRKALIKKLIKKVKSLHSYDVPEIIALPIIDGSKEYLEWIDESLR
jgi:periplasmic divalent cation tolerance protein